METVQDSQHFDLIQDKHKKFPKKLFQIREAIAQVELEKVAKNVIMNTSFEDATQHQPDIVKLKRRQLTHFDDKCTEWNALNGSIRHSRIPQYKLDI